MNGSALGRARTCMVSAAAKEASLGVGATIDTLFSISGEPPNLEFETVPNNDLANGYEEPTSQDVVTHYLKAPTIATPRATPDMLAFLMCAVLGVHTHTTTGGAGIHTITPQVPSITTVETFSLECLDVSGVQLKNDGVAANSLTLSGQRGGFLTLASDLMGSGKYAAATHTASEQTSEPRLHMKDVHVWFGAGSYAGATVTQATATSDLSGSPADITTNLEGFSYTPSKNIDPKFNFTVGGGLTWGRAERGDFGQTLELTTLMTQDDLTLILNQTNCAMQIKAGDPSKVINGGAKWYGFNLIWPLLQVKSYVKTGAVKGRVMVKFTLTVESDAVYGSFRGTVWNGRTTYLQ